MPVKKSAVDETGEIRIQRIGRAMARIRVEGTAPLIVNRFSSKARQQMLDAQQGKARTREAKNPEQCFDDARYRIDDDRDGVPATAFKGAIVDGARYFKGNKNLTMVALKQMIFVKGEGPELLVPIDGIAKMREDPVRNASGVADLRFRPEYWPWQATLEIIYVRGTFNIESLLALVDAGGMGGIGEWRPSSKQSKTGMFGTFHLVDEQDAKEIIL